MPDFLDNFESFKLFVTVTQVMTSNLNKIDEWSTTSCGKHDVRSDERGTTPACVDHVWIFDRRIDLLTTDNAGTNIICFPFALLSATIECLNCSIFREC
mmetsp:Transcript_22270/g.33433  ORF Transcript_22270/g.33433 Transcript_22270/m.33433 type:complete len:99 (-) Transcript_22270:92-388(-)